ncbi:hypothetical protein FB451DRAFT_1191185 [Mycena latifolia]|nr:hypothetical protein FB451DRAFT_1191185 [Mycena latifolia]
MPRASSVPFSRGQLQTHSRRRVLADSNTSPDDLRMPGLFPSPQQRPVYKTFGLCASGSDWSSTPGDSGPGICIRPLVMASHPRPHRAGRDGKGRTSPIPIWPHGAKRVHTHGHARLVPLFQCRRPFCSAGEGVPQNDTYKRPRPGIEEEQCEDLARRRREPEGLQLCVTIGRIAAVVGIRQARISRDGTCLANEDMLQYWGDFLGGRIKGGSALRGLGHVGRYDSAIRLSPAECSNGYKLIL